MKLSTKYNRVNGIAIIIVVLLSSVCYYYFIRNAFNHQLNKDLHVEEREITDFVKEKNALPEAKNYKNEQEEFVPLENTNITRNLRNVTIFNKLQNENISYRQLEFPIIVAGKSYKAIVRKSRVETEDLIKLILTSTLLMVLTLLLALFLVNHFLLNKLWMPFNSTLRQVKQFNLSGKYKVKWEDSDINEFTELNEAVSTMIQRVNLDYDEVKSFTENASHEIQTPLAIIKSKLELLSQSENLNEENMASIQSIYEATNRLSKLNQSLILLTKIDNQQFQENEEVNLGAIINKHLDNFEELIEAKHISTIKKISNDVKLLLNEALAEILISNLVTNAIKHNLNGGSIEVILNKDHLSISNTGAILEGDPSELFERFKKDKVSSESLGLGLSIVKRICERYGYKIKYDYARLHTISIQF